MGMVPASLLARDDVDDAGGQTTGSGGGMTPRAISAGFCSAEAESVGDCKNPEEETHGDQRPPDHEAEGGESVCERR